jgi:flagellar protein FlaI
MAPQALRNALLENTHLLVYLHKLDHIPAYKEQLSRGVDENIPSVVYPVGDPVFIHVFSRGPRERRLYIPIEPLGDNIPHVKNADSLINTVIGFILRSIREDEEVRTLKERRAKLRKYLNMVVKVSDRLAPGSYHKGDGGLIASRDVWKLLEYNVVREMAGVGPLEPMMRDPYIEDVSVPGAGPVYIEHKLFESCEATVRFSVRGLRSYAEKLGLLVGRIPSLKRPIVDGMLPDGSRLNIVYDENISLRGPNISIRRLSAKPMSIIELIRLATLDYMMAAYIWMLLDNNLNLWFCGETASGKTTLMNACLAFIPFNYKVVSIEETPEVAIPHTNWVRERTNEDAGVGLFELLRNALRQRPNYLIVGEIRGKEAYVAFQGMQTGHACCSTFHCGSVEQLIQRLTGHPIEVPKTFLDILNAITIQGIVRHPKTGKLMRKVFGIYEFLGYDPAEDRFNFIEIFSWDPATDSFIFRGEGMSYLLEERIARRRGVPKREVRRIYQELEERAEILRLADALGITDYYELFDLFKEVRLQGPSEVLESLKKKYAMMLKKQTS